MSRGTNKKTENKTFVVCRLKIIHETERNKKKLLNLFFWSRYENNKK